jgi:thiol:disulfide interchange protein DsbC
MRAVVAKRPDIAFFIKMLPLEIHPDAYAKAKAILCEKSLDLLEKSLDGQSLPPPACETDQIDKNKELAKTLGIGSTPTLVFPDGRVYPGSRPADKIIAILEGEGIEKPREDTKPQGAK